MQFYIIRNGAQQGPFDKSQLPELGILADTMVWYDGLPDWVPAGQAPETMFLFQSANPAMNGATEQGPQMPPPPQQPYQPYQQQYQYQQYQQYQQPEGMTPCPPNYLVWSILATLFCCLPLGIVAIVKGSHVNSDFYSGNYEGALRASRSAKNWLIATAVCGILWSIVYIIYAVVVAFGSILASAVY